MTSYESLSLILFGMFAAGNTVAWLIRTYVWQPRCAGCPDCYEEGRADERQADHGQARAQAAPAADATLPDLPRLGRPDGAPLAEVPAARGLDAAPGARPRWPQVVLPDSPDRDDDDRDLTGRTVYEALTPEHIQDVPRPAVEGEVSGGSGDLPRRPPAVPGHPISSMPSPPLGRVVEGYDPFWLERQMTDLMMWSTDRQLEMDDAAAGDWSGIEDIVPAWAEVEMVRERLVLG